jgi:hypothetical protein
VKRPLQVKQHEEHDGWGFSTFWYTVCHANGNVLLTSETYPSRRNAVRAARAFIAAIDPAPVRLSYWVGRFGAMEMRVERVR